MAKPAKAATPKKPSSVLDPIPGVRPVPTAKQTEKKAKTFMDKQADSDRDDAKTEHCAKGFKKVRDLVGRISKAAAHGLATEEPAQMRSCLTEIGNLGNSIRDTAREAVRNSRDEKRNLQP